MNYWSIISAVNFFCDMTDKEKHPYSHGIKNDIANKMSVFGVNPVDLKARYIYFLAFIYIILHLVVYIIKRYLP